MSLNNVTGEQIALGLDAVRAKMDLSSLCNDEEREVAKALRWGRMFAMQVPDIAELAGMPLRRVQEVIQHLLLEHQLPIGTSMSSPFGNYLIDTADDLTATVELLRTRGISHLQRAAALQRTTLREFIAQVQTSIDLEDVR